MCSIITGNMASTKGANDLPVLSDIMFISLKAAIFDSRALVFIESFYSPSNPFILKVKLDDESTSYNNEATLLSFAYELTA